MSIVAIIPARMASSRFPGKPLKQILGLSMIEHVRRRVSLCEIIDKIIVATCDKEIFDEVTSYGGQVVMTSNCHESCIDRVTEAAQGISADLIINVQGDMPLVDPESLKELVTPLMQDISVQYTDMINPITDILEINNPNVVKVVVSVSNNAIYYSREAIPSNKKAANHEVKYFKQLGINAFRKKSLERFSSLARTPVEITESVDMLRLLENDIKIRLVKTEVSTVGVDTPEDLVRVKELMIKDLIFSRYKE
ncbi:MAG: 3-deoxy-manno-octulosonate cytidylyltransferase [Bacteroidetes bacterium]|nr:3-deoxy-manno-octulosonate cytidylyltransferase [Bacteroidota bacterium]